MKPRPPNEAGAHRPGPSSAVGLHTDEVLPIREALERLGWGAAVFRQAKAKGLKVLCFGRRSYLWGADVLAFLQAQPTIERRGGPGRPDLQRDRLDSPSGDGAGNSREEHDSSGQCCRNHCSTP